MPKSKDREGVFDEIHNERQQQDEQWGGEVHDDGHAPTEWLGYIEHQIGRAKDTLTAQSQRGDEPDHYGVTRARLVKIAALAVAGIESIDRCTDAE